jgi:hypothetical protein
LLRRGGGFALALSVALALDVGGALAEPGKISVELNKLETQEKGCRAYVVVNNAGDTAYKSVKLDLVLFQPDGIIGRRFAVDLAPLKPQKRTVKIFDIEGTACDKVGSLLINDIMECSTDAGPVENCLAGLTLSTLTNVQLTK